MVDITSLPAMVRNTSSIDDSQVLRPPNAQSDEAFEAFMHTKRCPICMRVPRYPGAISSPECGHEGCMQCLSMVSSCPVGKCVTYDSRKLLPFKFWPHRAKVSFNQDLLVKCDSCDAFKSGTVWRLIKHEMRECPKRTVCCPKKLCAVQGTPEEMVKHYQTCNKTGSDGDDGNVTLHHIGRWNMERNAERLQSEVARAVQEGTFGPAASPRLVRTYRRGEMSQLNATMRSNVFEM